MQSTITSQIRKLDKDLNICKDRITELYRRKLFDVTTQTNLKKKKKRIVRNTNMDKNKKKKGHLNSVPDTVSRKLIRGHKNSNAGNKDQLHTEIYSDASGIKSKKKPRSRSVSSSHDAGASQENEYKNNLIIDDQRVILLPKTSWGNILKEQNNGDIKCRTPFSHRQEMIAKNLCHFDEKQLRDKYCLIKESQKPYSIFMKNKGIQCSEQVFGPHQHSPLTGTYFSYYNPTRALQFLMSEFREHLKYKADDKMLNIVNDMEDVITRIKPIHDVPKSLEPNLNLYPKVGNIESETKISESYNKLESTCQTLEAACTRLKDEKHQLERELDSKKVQLRSLECRLADSNGKITKLNSHIYSLNQKSDAQSQTIRELSSRIEILQQDKRSFDTLMEVQLKLQSKIDKLKEENEILSNDNQLLLLDKKKNSLLLEIKGQQLARLKSDIQCLGGDVSEKLVSVHAKVVTDESVESDAPLCSSPNTSLGSSPAAYPSWRRVSSISSLRSSEPPVTAGDDDPPHGIELLKTELKAMFTELRAQTIKQPSSSTENESELWKDFHALPSDTGFMTVD